MASWPQCGRYVEQAQACATLIEQYGLQSAEAVALLERTGVYLVERGRYHQAEPLLVCAVAIQEQRSDADALRTADLLLHLARLLTLQGKPKAALEYGQRGLAPREQQLGPDHLEVATALSWVGNIIFDLEGNYIQAERLHQRALQIREQQAGPDHLLVAKALHNLGIASLALRRYTQAEMLLLRGLRIREAQLEPDHPDTLSTLTALAMTYTSHGRYAEAEPLFQRGLRLLEQQ